MTSQEFEELEILIQLLLDMGVAEYSGYGHTIKFRDTMAPHQSEHGGIVADPHRKDKAEQGTSQWHHPALWGGLGKPPEFPK